MSINLQPPVPLVTLVKTEPPRVIKNELPEEALEEISTDIKEIDIVYHPLCEDLIKSDETVLEDILENKHLESVQTQALVVKTENSPFIKTENITQRNKSEDTSDGNVSKGTGQGVVGVQALNEHSNTLSNLETDEQSVLNFSKILNGVSVRSRKSKSPKKTDLAECYKTDGTTLWEKEKAKIKVIKAPVIPVEAHEYISLVNDRHVCNHCQHAYNRLDNLKSHIRKLHREVTTMYQCPYCPFKSKWSVQMHIIQKHKDTKEIQWFQCNLCEMKFKLKKYLTQHMKAHLKHKQMKDALDLREKRYGCNECTYETYTSTLLKRHKLVHLRPKEVQYVYCYHCSHKSKVKSDLKKHIFRQHFKNVTQGKRYGCNKCDYETYTSTQLKSHKLTHLKPEEIQYFYCYHCYHKSKQKSNLINHIFRHHFKNVKRGKRYDCNECTYETYTSTLLKRHKLVHLRPEEIQYFYCYYCSHKSKVKSDLKKHIFRQHFKNVTQGKPEDIPYFHCYHCFYKSKKKVNLQRHIFKHLKNGEVKFDCYICNFMTQKRESIIEHIKKHSKVQINEGS